MECGITVHVVKTGVWKEKPLRQKGCAAGEHSLLQLAWCGSRDAFGAFARPSHPDPGKREKIEGLGQY